MDFQLRDMMWYGTYKIQIDQGEGRGQYSEYSVFRLCFFFLFVSFGRNVK